MTPVTTGSKPTRVGDPYEPAVLVRCKASRVARSELSVGPHPTSSCARALVPLEAGNLAAHDVDGAFPADSRVPHYRDLISVFEIVARAELHEREVELSTVHVLTVDAARDPDYGDIEVAVDGHHFRRVLDLDRVVLGDKRGNPQTVGDQRPVDGLLVSEALALRARVCDVRVRQD